jgi:hypothetical protein
MNHGTHEPVSGAGTVDTARQLMQEIGKAMPDMNVIRRCAAQGDVNAGDFGGKTALMVAACYAKDDIVTLLLDAGADPRLANRFNETARSLAVQRNHTAIAAQLLEAEQKLDRPEAGTAAAAPLRRGLNL